MRLYLWDQNVPVGPAVLVEIGAQIAVWELALDQFGGNVIQLLAQGRVLGIDPGQGRGMEPFADVLAVVGLAAGPLAVALQEARRIELDQAVGFVDLDAPAHPAAQTGAVGRLGVLPVRDHRSDPIRHARIRGLDRAGRGGQEQHGSHECGGMIREKEEKMLSIHRRAFVGVQSNLEGLHEARERSAE